MSIKLEEIRGLKVIPKNYESSTVCSIGEVMPDKFELDLDKLEESELDDYAQGSEIEVFGLHKNGIAYFTSTILEKNAKKLLVKFPDEVSEIQRRKYSRVRYEGTLKVSDYDNAKIIPCDISAGGLRFISDNSFVVGNEYDIKIELLNNLIINCTMQPIRVEEASDESQLYSISVKFKKIRSIDRIALMQYSLRRISELENKK